MSVHESDEENRRQKNAALVHEMHFYIGAPAGISPELRTPLVVKDEPDAEALTVGAKVGFLKFQKGPLAEVDRNGIMLEELLPELIRLVDGYNQVVPCRETFCPPAGRCRWPRPSWKRRSCGSGGAPSCARRRVSRGRSGSTRAEQC